MSTPISVDQVAAYMAAVGAATDCPICKGEGWGVIDDQPGMVWAVPALYPNGAISAPMTTVPVVVMACVNCAFIRMHARMPIEQWLATRPGGLLG